MSLLDLEARKLYSIQDVLGLSGAVKWIVCPLPGHIHKSNTPSFSIYWHGGVQYFRCHGNCGKSGDVIDLIGEMRISGYDRNNREHLAMALSMLDDKPVSVPTPPKTTRLNPNVYTKYLPAGDEVIAYAATRGLTKETIEKFHIGQHGNYMSMPSFRDHCLEGIKFRRIAGSGLRFYSAKGSVRSLFNYDAVKYTNKTVFVVKGEIPAMLLDQSGFLACAPTGGEGSLAAEFRQALSFANVIVVGDNDVEERVRERMQEKARERARALGGRAVFPPDAYKDIDEWMLAEPIQSIMEISKWQ